MQAARSCSRRPRIRRAHCSLSQANYSAWCSRHRSRGHLINRYYDPTTAQFLSIDPLVASTGQPYQYAGDDPVNTSDPSGLITAQACAGNGPIGRSPKQEAQACADEQKKFKANSALECANDPSACRSELPPGCSFARKLIASVYNYIALHSGGTIRSSVGGLRNALIAIRVTATGLWYQSVQILEDIADALASGDVPPP